MKPFPVSPTPSPLVPEAVARLDKIVDYLVTTPEDSWWGGPTFRNPDETRHCVLSHIYEQFGAGAMNWFENTWSTSYAIGAVNDAPSSRYLQPTPKQRCLAFLTALRDGTEEDTVTSMNRQFEMQYGFPPPGDARRREQVG